MKPREFGFTFSNVSMVNWKDLHHALLCALESIYCYREKHPQEEKVSCHYLKAWPTLVSVFEILPDWGSFQCGAGPSASAVGAR